MEIKSVRCTTALDSAQVLTYLRLTGLRLGLLVNFDVPLLKDGLRRFVV